MRRRKAAGVLILLVFLGILVQMFRIDKIDGAQWPKELPSAAAGKDFALAVIYADAAGAELSWEFADSREALVDRYFLAREGIVGNKENGSVPWLFMKMRLGDLKGTDIWNWLLQNKQEGCLYHCIRVEKGEGYYFVLNREDDEEQGIIYGRQILLIQDGSCWLLECCGITEKNRKAVSGLLMDFRLSLNPHSGGGTGMGEEALYWTDHDRRETCMQDPKREFVEIKTRWENCDGQADSYDILLKEAHYQECLAPMLPEMKISFYFEGKIKVAGEEIYLLRDYWRSAPYRMEVRTAEDGRLIQESQVQLTPQETDTVRFADLNDDGFLDMEMDFGYGIGDCYLWDARQETFQQAGTLVKLRGTDSRAAKNNGGQEAPAQDLPVLIKVQKGDSLWRIAERLYGDGNCYTVLYDKNRQRIGEDPSFLPEGLELELPEGEPSE